MAVSYYKWELFDKPWWDWECLEAGENFCVKRLTVKPGEILSLQMHHHRSEHWVVVQWVATITKNEDTFLLHPGQSVSINQWDKHRFWNAKNEGEDMVLIEVQYGEDLREDDVVRFEDKYGREGTNEG